METFILNIVTERTLKSVFFFDLIQNKSSLSGPYYWIMNYRNDKGLLIIDRVVFIGTSEYMKHKETQR